MTNDWNPPRTFSLADASEMLPAGIPAWAMMPLLGAGALVVYLILYNLFTRRK